MKKNLIIYAKRPLPGYAKTRLGATVGMDASAGVYARILYTYLLDLMKNCRHLYQIVLSVSSPDDVAFFKLAFPELTVSPQVDGDLGFRMDASFHQAYYEGADCAVLTGSDIPGLSSDIVAQAFNFLESYDTVIGPAMDGGYYLIGMRSPGFQLFNNIKWSTDHVLEDTENHACQLNLTVAHVPTLTDMDDQVAYEGWLEKIKLEHI